uniref:Uncharacterized protein n=1 Tax=Fagus sylvatica TaxID=28930 RepID=A0A2N9IYM8_FAGSY
MKTVSVERIESGQANRGSNYESGKDDVIRADMGGMGECDTVQVRSMRKIKDIVVSAGWAARGGALMDFPSLLAARGGTWMLRIDPGFDRFVDLGMLY